MTPGDVCVVIPTVGRSSLGRLLAVLVAGAPPDGPEILLVDDRPGAVRPLPVPAAARDRVRVLAGSGAGPAAARNAGWQASHQPWVAFLDDDVVPDPDWLGALLTDLDVSAEVGGVQGRVRVPPPDGRRPTDWERATAGLAGAEWITADMAYRRGALAAAGGFDERFRRAYREDSELAHRVRRAGWVLVRGRRGVVHPVRPEGPWVSLRVQRGNADDGLLRRMYGPPWRSRLGVPPGRRHRHAAITAAGVVALLAGMAGRGGTASRVAAAGAAAGWLAGVGELSVVRIRPGPRTPREVAIMIVTSVLIPPVAVAHWIRGWWAGRGARPLGAGLEVYSAPVRESDFGA